MAFALSLGGFVLLVVDGVDDQFNQLGENCNDLIAVIALGLKLAKEALCRNPWPSCI